jgi:hypothetical protein
MMISRADIKIASAGAKKAKSDLNWERESKTLELMYDSLVGNEIG